MPTPLALMARLWDLDTNTAVSGASTGLLTAYSRRRTLDKVGYGKIAVSAGTHLANALITAGGGASGGGAIKSYLLEVSEDGGTVWDFRKFVLRPTRALEPPYEVTEEGDDIGFILSIVGEDRATWMDQTLGTIFNQSNPPGTFNPPKGLLLNINGKPGQPAGSEARITPAAVIDTAIHLLTFTVDSYADTLLSALTQICARVGGTFISTDTVPLGFRGHWFLDPSSMSLYVGHVPTTAALTFVPGTISLADEATKAQYIADGALVQVQLDGMFAQVEAVGGTSTHGMPANGKIVDVVLINHTVGYAWDSFLPVVAISADDGAGGVFFYPHDGALHPASQAMDARSLVYDEAGAKLYVASARGVLSATATGAALTSAPAWSQVGGLTDPCVEVQVDGGVVTAHVSAATPKKAGKATKGTDTLGIYCHPAITSDTSGAKRGYNGWSLLAGGDFICYAYRASNDMLLCVDKATPETLIRHVGVSSGTTTTTHITTPGSVPITALALEGSGCYVVTAAGSAGLYYLTDAATGMSDANSDGTLVAPFTGAAIPILRIVPCNTGLGTLTNAQVVACTGAGLFACDRAGGSTAGPPAHHWVNITEDAGPASASVSYFAASGDQNVYNATFIRVYTGNDSSFYVSNSNGYFWYDLLTEPLDMGPFWQKLWQQAASAPLAFADNDTGSLGNLVGVTDTGGSGTTEPIPGGNPRVLPDNWIWARRLSKRNDFTYRLVNLVSEAPAGGIQFGELSVITADAATPVITASEQIAVACFRYLGEASVPQTIIPLRSQYHTQEAALRTLSPGDLVHLTGTLAVDNTVGTAGAGGIGDGASTSLMSYTNAPFYVLEHAPEMAGPSTMFTQTRLGSRLGEQVVSLADIAAAIALDSAKHKRYRSGRR